MQQHQLLTAIAFTVLMAAFPIASSAQEDDVEAERVTGQVISSRVPGGCGLKITNTDVFLYLNRSLENTRITTVPVGSYQPLDYKPGWYRIQANGWKGWVQDSVISVKKVNACPQKVKGQRVIEE